MTQTIKRPRTVRELGAWCSEHDMSIEQGLDFFAPWPTRPAGFVMTKRNEDCYIGDDVVNRKHIITPVWTASTNRRSIDLWTLREPGENEAHLTPQEAIQLATDLLRLAHEALASDASENKESK